MNSQIDLKKLNRSPASTGSIASPASTGSIVPATSTGSIAQAASLGSIQPIKRVLAALLCVVLCLSMFACSGGNNPQGNPNNPGTNQQQGKDPGKQNEENDPGKNKDEHKENEQNPCSDTNDPENTEGKDKENQGSSTGGETTESSIIERDALYTSADWKELDAFETLAVRELTEESGLEYDTVFGESDIYVLQNFYDANNMASENDPAYVKNKSYHIFGIYDIDVGCAGLNRGVKIYRIEWGLEPENYKDIETSNTIEITDGTYYRFDYITYAIARYDDDETGETYWDVIDFVDSNELKALYTDTQTIEIYSNPYRACAMKLLAKDNHIKDLAFDKPGNDDYQVILLRNLNKSSNLANIKKLIEEYSNRKVFDLECIDYESYDESSFSSYKVQFDTEQLYYIIVSNIECSEVIAADIPEYEYTNCPEEVAERIRGLISADASLRIDPYGLPYGPGSEDSFFGITPYEMSSFKTRKRSDIDVIYSEGSYWYEVNGSGLYALCYFDSESKMGHIQQLESTRNDICSFRGTRIGDNRENVNRLYDNMLSSKPLELLDIEGDYMWYSEYMDENEELLYGPAIIFFFENDCVSKMEVINFFN